MNIKVALTDPEIVSAFPVMKLLRPNLKDQNTFLENVKRMSNEGYKISVLSDPDVRAVAGYRIIEMLATGKTLYVDDLVTASSHRSTGYGKVLLDWLKSEAQQNGCRFLTLDSGMKRIDAHRFYRSHGLEEIGFHFAIPVDGGDQWTSE